MPKIIAPLTDTKIRQTAPSAKPLRLFDGKVGGLHVLVQPSGAKLWRLRFKINGQERRTALGVYPSVSLSEARETAEKLLQQARKGVDPTAPAVVNTFAAVAEKFIDWKISVSRSPGTIRKYRECLSNDILPEFGEKDIAAIHTPQVVVFLEKVNQRSNSLANKSKELIAMVIRFAVQRGYRPPYSNLDLAGIVTRQKSKEKRMIASDSVPWESVGRCRSPVMQAAIKIQFLCFLRASETMGAAWAEIDFIKMEWNIPASRMKMRRQHVVPLAQQSIAILKDLQKLTGGTPFLFPSLHKDGHMTRDALSKIFRDLDLGLHPHACRTLAGTWMRNNGVPPHVVEAQLSHIEANQIAAAYQHAPHLMYLKERVEAMQQWADHLLGNEKKD